MASNDGILHFLREPDLASQYYEQLGRALSSWAHVESAMATLFSIALRSQDPRVSQASFWSIVSLDGKRAMLRSAIEGSCQGRPDIISKWKSIDKSIKTKSSIRNKLAHGSISWIHWSDADGDHTDLYLAPYLYSEKVKVKIKGCGGDPRPGNRMYLSEIVDASVQFTDLNAEIWLLLDDVHKALQKANREQGIQVRLALPIRDSLRSNQSPQES